MSAKHRSDPYSLVFDAEFENLHFQAIASEAEQRGLNTWQPEQFMLLHAVAEPLRATVATEGASAVEQFGPLLFQAYHYWRFQKSLVTVSEPLFRHVATDFPPIGQWEVVPLYAAGYLQLPRNLLWARIAEDAQPEAVDGIFWTMVGTGEPLVPPFTRADLLVVLGLIPGRPGYSVIPLSAELEEPQGHWGDEQARTNSPDFANNLPGGELQQLHALETAGEVWKLVSRLFWYGAQHPDALDPETRQFQLVSGRG
jgi:hypothetical protein